MNTPGSLNSAVIITPGSLDSPVVSGVYTIESQLLCDEDTGSTVDFLVYWEQVSEQGYEKTFWLQKDEE
jgi:hypothetical protein